MNNWYGWIIEQSLDNQDIFDLYPTVKMKSEEADWTEHILEIPENLVDEVVQWLEKHIKLGWYTHLVRGDDIIILFKEKSFRLKNGDSFKEVADYSRSHGIPEDQLPENSLFDLSRESGF